MPRPLTVKHALIDGVKEYLDLSRDTDVAEALRVQPSCISKIRRGTNKVSALVLLRIHLLTDVPVRELITYCSDDELEI